MPKVELVGVFKHKKGWKETVKLVEEKMSEWGDKLKDWTVRIQEFAYKDKNEDEYEDLNFAKVHWKNKILRINYLPNPVTDPEKDANIIMQEFEDLEEQGKI
ncbi:hypothetical protein ES702_07025 [subsurface metagenome]